MIEFIQNYSMVTLNYFQQVYLSVFLVLWYFSMKNNNGYDIQNGLNWKRYVGCVKIHLNKKSNLQTKI